VPSNHERSRDWERPRGSFRLGRCGSVAVAEGVVQSLWAAWKMRERMHDGCDGGECNRIRAHPGLNRISIILSSPSSPRVRAWARVARVSCRNVTIEFRYAGDQNDRQPPQLAELVSRRVAVIFASGGDLRRAMKTIEFLADPTAGEVRIGSSALLAGSFVSALVDRLSQRYPGIVFPLVTGHVDTPWGPGQDRARRGKGRELACQGAMGRPRRDCGMRGKLAAGHSVPLRQRMGDQVGCPFPIGGRAVRTRPPHHGTRLQETGGVLGHGETMEMTRF
jgi:hypothetical protein